MSSYARAYVQITYEKKQKENSLENITWSEMGKQNLQVEEVNCVKCWTGFNFQVS